MNPDVVIKNGTDPVKVRADQLRLEEQARDVIRRERALEAMTLPPARDTYTLTSYARRYGHLAQCGSRTSRAHIT